MVRYFRLGLVAAIVLAGLGVGLGLLVVALDRGAPTASQPPQPPLKIAATAKAEGRGQFPEVVAVVTSPRGNVYEIPGLEIAIGMALWRAQAAQNPQLGPPPSVRSLAETLIDLRLTAEEARARGIRCDEEAARQQQREIFAQVDPSDLADLLAYEGVSSVEELLSNPAFIANMIDVCLSGELRSQITKERLGDGPWTLDEINRVWREFRDELRRQAQVDWRVNPEDQ
jgi:hypothetical protein